MMHARRRSLVDDLTSPYSALEQPVVERIPRMPALLLRGRKPAQDGTRKAVCTL